MKILVAGAGGVGGYYGARLTQAGNEVTFLARGKKLEALRRDGLTVHSDLGDARLPRVRAVEHGEGAGRADAVLFCVKTYDNEPGAHAIAGAVGAGSTVCSLQNGVENEAFLQDRFPEAVVVGGVARVETWLRRPGGSCSVAPRAA